MTDANSSSIYRHAFTTTPDAVDQNGHVNNVIYVQWMQDVAILHSEATGGTQATQTAGATWVALELFVFDNTPSKPKTSVGVGIAPGGAILTVKF